jgi:1-acyl-sn-glycerol-3-phosphate acyltransferase
MKQEIADNLISLAAALYAGRRIRCVAGGSPRPEGPVLFAANHPTTLDPILLQKALGRPVSTLITSVAFSLPLVGRLLRGAGHLPVGQRGEGGRSLVEAAAAPLRSGRSVAIFPEGQLSPEGSLAALRSGAVRIAAASGAPIVPVGIATAGHRILEIGAGFEHGYERGRFLLGGWYVLRFGPALGFALDPEDREAVKDATASLSRAMERQVTEARALLALLEGEEWRDLSEAPGLCSA